MKKRVSIGVTGPWPGHRAEWLMIRHGLRRAGARCHRLRPTSSTPVADLDGLVLPGGEDLETNPVRDRFELERLAQADRLGLPVLGICRGSQLLNVAAGGTLHRDVSPWRPADWPRRMLRPRLDVRIAEHSRLAHWLRTLALGANCLHHQAVQELGEGLRVAALDRFGIVQAIEAQDHPFRIGVQWHPELLPNQPTHRRLFAALVAAAA